MKLKTNEAPHIRHHQNTRSLMLDVMLAMLFLYGIAFYYYGMRALTLGLVSILTAVICDLLCTLLAKRSVNPRDLSSLVTGMLLPLFMPASVSYPVVITAAIFAIAVAKHPFGGLGQNIFNPAAAGFCFVAMAFADQLFLYPLPFSELAVWGPITSDLVNSPAFTLSLGGIPQYDLAEMLLGNFPGPMGATNIVVILACLLYLILRNTIRWQIPVFFFLTVAVFSLLFPRGGAYLDLTLITRMRLTAYELMSGFLLLGGTFMLGDPVTTPKRDWAKLFFAVLAGMIVMLFRKFGAFEDTLPFAVLLLNSLVWNVDICTEKWIHRRRKLQKAG